MLQLNPAVWINKRNQTCQEGIYKGMPIILPLVLTLDGQKDAVMDDQSINVKYFNYHESLAFINAARLNLDRLFNVSLLREANYLLNKLLAVELCHLMVGLDIHGAIATAECQEQSLQETYVKLTIHWQKHRHYWQAIAEEISQLPYDSLDPLVTTIAMQLSLEELAQHDLVSYSALASFFSYPAQHRAAQSIVTLLTACVHDNIRVKQLITAWQQSIVSNKHSYASVAALRPHGYPYRGDILHPCLKIFSPLNWQAISKICQGLRNCYDAWSAFYFGIYFFSKEEDRQWPYTKINWLSQ